MNKILTQLKQLITSTYQKLKNALRKKPEAPKAPEFVSTPEGTVVVANPTPAPTPPVATTPSVPSNPILDSYIHSGGNGGRDISTGSTGDTPFVFQPTMKYDYARGQAIVVTGKTSFWLTDCPAQTTVQLSGASGQVGGPGTLVVNQLSADLNNPQGSVSITVNTPSVAVTVVQDANSKLGVFIP